MSESVLLVWSEELLTYDLGATHPMAPGRLEFTMALAHDLGVLAGPGTRIAGSGNSCVVMSGTLLLPRRA